MLLTVGNPTSSFRTGEFGVDAFRHEATSIGASAIVLSRYSKGVLVDHVVLHILDSIIQLEDYISISTIPLFAM